MIQLKYILTTLYNSTTLIVAGSTISKPHLGTKSSPSFLKQNKTKTKSVRISKFYFLNLFSFYFLDNKICSFIININTSNRIY